MCTNYDDNKNIMIVFVCLRFLIFFIVTQEQLILQGFFPNFTILFVLYSLWLVFLRDFVAEKLVQKARIFAHFF